MRKIADATGGNLFTVGSPDQLATTFVSILDEFRARYVLLYSPEGVGRGDGWHTLKISIKNKKVKVKARPGYFSSR